MNDLKKNNKLQRRAKRLCALLVCLALAMAVTVIPAFAADGDPLTTVSNLSDFIFSLIRAIGLILLGYGILQVWACPSRATTPPSAPTVCSPSPAAS